MLPSLTENDTSSSAVIPGNVLVIFSIRRITGIVDETWEALSKIVLI
jgi:hypothetical protein